jgi:enoyl-[acyl-carrier-protein] reductase (NADH)
LTSIRSYQTTLASLTPLRRESKSAALADAGLFFLSPRVRAVTKQNLIADSGLFRC